VDALGMAAYWGFLSGDEEEIKSPSQFTHEGGKLKAGTGGDQGNDERGRMLRYFASDRSVLGWDGQGREKRLKWEEEDCLLKS